MRLFNHWFISAFSASLLLIVAGCGGSKPYDVVRVSGTVTLDGQPVADARVEFQPVATSVEGMGPDAVGTTDAQGRYTLTTTFDENGATVGENRVRISTHRLKENPDNPDGKMIEVAPEKIPARYNTRSELTFTVPPGGTDQADFALQSR